VAAGGGGDDLVSWSLEFRDCGRVIEVPENANVREACMREGVRLYGMVASFTNCGGAARCGTCKVTVVEGEDRLSPPTPPEVARKGDAGTRHRLACQANVRGDVILRRGW